MSPNTNSVIGIVMGTMTVILSFCYVLPQLYQLCKTRNTSGISLTSYIVYIITSILWVIWSVGFYYEQTHSYNSITCGNKSLFVASLIPAIILNAGDILIMLFITFFKIHSLIICKKLSISELELAKIEVNKFKQNNLFKFWPFVISLICTFTLILIIILMVLFLTNIVSKNISLPWLIAINVLASLTWEIFNWPQFIKTIRTKDTSGISLFWAVFILVACVVTFSYDLSMGFAGNNFNWSTIGGLICNGIIPATGFLFIKINNKQKKKYKNLL